MLEQEDVAQLDWFAWFATDKAWFNIATAYDVTLKTSEEADVRVAFEFDCERGGDAELCFKVGEEWVFSLEVDRLLKKLIAVTDLKRKLKR